MLKTPSFLHPLRQKSPQQEQNKASPPHLPDLILTAGRLAALMQQGRHGHQRVGAGENFWQFRPHLPHEPASYIDWRQSARIPDPRVHWVRERERETPRALTLWIDPSASMQWRSHKSLPFKADTALTCALALGHSALKAGEHVSVLGHKRGYHNAQHLPRLAYDLSRNKALLPNIAHAPPHSQLLLIGDFLWNKETCSHVLNLCRHRPGRTYLLAVLDPAELGFPYKGRVRFSDPEGGPDFILPAVENLKKPYRAAMEAHFAQFHSIMGPRAHFVSHVTSHPLLPPLLALHNILGDKA